MSSLGKNKPHSVPKVGAISRSVAKSRYSGKREDIKQRLLLSSLYSAKRHKQTPSNYRSFFFKQKYKEKGLKDARSQFNSPAHKTGNVGSEIRSKGRILPRPSPPVGLEVLQILPSQERIPAKGFLLQKNAIRSDHSTVGIHKDLEASVGDPKASGDYSVCVFGRFFNLSSLQRGSFERHGESHKVVTRSRVQDKLVKVLSSTSQNRRISWSGRKSGRINLQSSRREDPKDPLNLSFHARSLSNIKEVTGVDSRVPHFRCKLSKVGKTSAETSSSLDELQHFSGSEGPVGVSGRILQRGISSLAKRKLPTNPHILRGGGALGRNHDGHLGGRLVGSPSPQDPVGKLARTLESSLNELERAKGNPLISSSFQGRFGGPEGNGLVRQRDCNVLPEETRILVFPRSNGSNSGYLCSPRGSEHFSSSNTFEGKNQCLGRPGVQEGSHPDRVVPRQQNFPLVLQASGNPSSGFVCHPVQPEA